MLWPNGTPTMPDITSPYGYSSGYSGFHGGTDFVGFDTNYAVAAGTVVWADWSDIGDHGGGLEVRIQHDGFISRTLHHERVDVTVGQVLKQGQSIGVQGGSGYGKQNYFGKHCHCEIWVGSTVNGRTDPVPYISARLSSAAGGDSRPFPEDESEPDMPILYYNGNDTDTGKRYFWSEGYGHVFGAKDYPNIITQALPLGKQTGAINLQTDAAFDKFVTEHRQGYATGGVTVNATTDPKVLAALAALPAQIATALLDLEAKRLAS